MRAASGRHHERSESFPASHLFEFGQSYRTLSYNLNFEDP